MPAKVNCPECNAKLLIKGAIPKKIECPKCGATFRPDIEIDEPEPIRKKSTASSNRDDDAEPETTRKKSTPKPKRVEEEEFDFETKSNKKSPRKSRANDTEEDEKPTRRKKKKSTPKRQSFPLWLGVSIAAAVVGIVVLIVMLSGGKKDKSKEVAEDAPATKFQPGPFQVPPRDPKLPPFKEPQFPGGPKERPAVNPDDAVALRDIADKIEIPPLPPLDQRPILVLDPGGHSGNVKRVLFTPSGKELITVSADKTIRIWDVATGETIKTILMPNGPGDEGSLAVADISSDGKFLAVSGVPLGRGAKGILVYLLSLETYEIEKVYKGHLRGVTSLAFSPTGEYLASSSYDGSALITQVKTGLIVGEMKTNAEPIRQVLFHPIDGRLATASQDGTARIWTATKGKFQSKVLSGHQGPVLSISWNPDGSTLATGGIDGSIRIWSSDGALLKTISRETLAEKLNGKLEPTQIVSLNYAKNGKELLYSGIAFTGVVGILDVETGTTRIHFVGHSNTVQHSAFSQDGSLAASTGGDFNETFIWDTRDGSRLQRFQGGGKTIWALGSTRDQKGIVWGTINRGKAIPPTRAVEQEFQLDTFNFRKPAAGFLPAVVQLQNYTLSQPDFFHLQVKNQGQDYYTYVTEGQEERLYSGTLLDKDRLIVGGAFALQLVDLKQKKVVRTFAGHTGIVTSVAPFGNGDFFVSGSIDQTIRIWSPDKVDPVLSLFFAGREWIAWTPEGYYSASANGERLMGWQMNNGIDKVGTFYPAIQFRASLYQPEVIQNLFRAKGNLRDALALTISERKKPIGVVNLNQVLPPVVQITSPVSVAGGAALNEETIEVKATAKSTGNYPVRAVRLLLDGRPYDGPRGLKLIEQPKLGEVQTVWKVTLSPGRHTLLVQAESQVSKGMSAPLEIVQNAGDKRLPNLFVFAVGVNDYPGAMKLNFASTDATSITKVLRERTKSVFGKVEIKLLLDKDATRQNVLGGLDWLETNMTARDVGIFYFSGHGGKDAADNFFLVPVDVGRNLTATGVSGEIVKQKLSSIQGRMVAIFDACHSGAAAESFQSGQADNLVRDLLTDDCGVVVLCSSLGSEYSLESGETKAGFFTLGLVEGLSGKADFNKDGYVFIHEAAAYAVLRVQQLSGGDQNPTLGRSPNLKPFALTKP